ncbi:glycosyltransferase [bacterium]|nr:glycosyltransferase [bacterium]
MRPSSPLVSILCITYNQENFIADALNGFVMQQTSFPFEIIIHDDASTDGTAEIIKDFEKEYPDLIRAIYQTENQYSQGIIVEEPLYRMARGRYIAICEGDDYWIDAQKLEKQVDFMIAHPDCSICYHKVLFQYENKKEKNHIFPEITGDVLFSKEDFFGRYISATCSIIIENKYVDELFEFGRKVGSGDIALAYFFATKGKVGFLDDLMGVYRLHDQSVYHPLDDLEKDLAIFNTFVSIKRFLKIRGYRKLDKKILNYALRVLEGLNTQDERKAMRKVLFNSMIATPAFDRVAFKQYLQYAKSAFSLSKRVT